MPAQKDVLPLGNLCVECITSLLADIVRVSTTKVDDNKTEDQKLSTTKVDDNKTEDQEVLTTKVDDNKTEDQEIINTKHSQENGEINNRDNSEGKTFSESEVKTEIKKSKTDPIKLDRLETYRKDLVGLLTSHSHVLLHDKMFSSLVSRLSETYMSKKKMRPLIQDIVPYFLNTSLRCLDFGKSRMFAEAEMCQILLDHLENASRLTTLDIGRSCYWRQNVFENLSSKLKSLPELSVLRIQYICTPDMIIGLADSCPNLLELNVKGSEKITDKECDEIAKCLSLKFLEIAGTRITGKGCWKIIDSIKTLSWLQHCAFNCNSDALLFESRAQLFDCIKEQVNRRNEPVERNESVEIEERSSLNSVFNLKNFWLFNPTTEDLSSVLLCPQLEHLRLDFIFQDVEDEPDVSVLSQLSKINKLEANLYDRCALNLAVQMIDGCGIRLTTLDLHLADDYFYAAQAHNTVAHCCPNLVTLRFSGDYKARHSLDESDSCLDFEIEAPAHPKLEIVSITGVVSDCRLRFILNHAPSIRNLHLDGELEWLHDDMFKTILDENPLPYLEYVWFNVSTTLTLSTVRLLLLHDNSIHTIGRLCHMASANMTEYQELQDLVRRKNLDVKLIWVTDERTR